MSSLDTLSPPATPLRRAPIVPSSVLGMLIFVATEVMFFAGLVSAHTISRAAAPLGWPPPGQPRLPLESTAFNTVALLASGVFVVAAGRMLRSRREEARLPLGLALFLGTFFVFAQGVEWVELLREGLTLTSSPHGSFFYVIVGAHGLHALAAIAALAWSLVALVRGRLTDDAYAAVRVFWLFVVGIWPFLYLKVYL